MLPGTVTVQGTAGKVVVALLTAWEVNTVVESLILSKDEQNEVAFNARSTASHVATLSRWWRLAMGTALAHASVLASKKVNVEDRAMPGAIV